MSIDQWSTVAANNASGVTGINWAEGQAPSTVNDSARELMAQIAAWLANPTLVSSIGAFTTGDAKLTFKTVADTGWVLMNDGTIGNATSGATTRANADTSALFTLLWNNTANADCAVSTGRGATAAADYAANKTIALPKALGRALACYGAGSGLTSRALAKILGAEDAVNIDHGHGITDPGHLHSGGMGIAGGAASGGSVGIVNTGTSVTSITVNNSGVSGVGLNIPPTTYLNVMVKL